MPSKPLIPIRVVVISLDSHLRSAVETAEANLKQSAPGLSISFHAATDWNRDAASLEDCKRAVAEADIIVAAMLFIDEHIKPILPALQARRDHCDAIAGCLSATEVVKLTRLGRFAMDKPQTGPVAFLKRLRGSSDKKQTGLKQAKLLRRLPKLLKYIPGAAQDVRAYFLTLQYWLAGSDRNIEGLIANLVHRYAAGPREALRKQVTPRPPEDYPDVGVYHPRMSPKIAERADKLPLARSKKPTVGLLVMRSYVLSGDAAHYDGVIAALEARGLRVIPAFASGLDCRPAMEKFFFKRGAPIVDAVLSLTGFPLVGGPAYNDADAAADMLADLDVPYVAAHALEFQSLSEWRDDARGLTPVEATMMVAMPELDGATGPIVFGGRDDGETSTGKQPGHRMRADVERADRLAGRVRALIDLRRKTAAERKLAIVIFNFPPNGGAVGTAASLSVFESLYNTLIGLKQDGYAVDVPSSVDELRDRL
ncbi:MAG: cobaltochelatase subunit CobN, partial [Pseudomonadota bacterium]